MGNVINGSASAEYQLGDARLTLQLSAYISAEWGQDAERFLGETVAVATTLEEELEAGQAVLADLRARQAALNHTCNDLVARTKDELYNDMGRTRNEPRFKRIFTKGKQPYTDVPAGRKPQALRRLVRMLGTFDLPNVSPERITASSAALLEAADRLAAVNDQLDPQRDEVELVRGQLVATAREAQQQLARLKGYWRAMGVSEVDVHRMIPDRPAKSRSKIAVAAEAGDTATEPEEAVELTVLEEDDEAAAK